MKFAREIWWDVLLGHYAWSVEQSHGSATFLAPGARESANQQVTSDLRFLFRCSLHWLAFMNPSRLLRQLRDPVMRATLQPSFVWAALALATFFQSSDLESAQGARGRDRALRMRDEAQSALEASLVARWIDNGLAQASWVSRLALWPRFERYLTRCFCRPAARLLRDLRTSHAFHSTRVRGHVHT